VPTKIASDIGDLLATWLGRACSPDNAKVVAKKVGYNDSPIFGAEKKRTHLMSEIVIVNTAILIYAVNCVFHTHSATDSTLIRPPVPRRSGH
jgi:hypothetical protein